MLKAIRVMISLTVISILLIGCSNGSNNPVIPRDSGANLAENQLPQISEGGESNSQRNFDGLPNDALVSGELDSIGMLGSYELNLDMEQMSAELITGRRSTIGESYLVSGIHYFDIHPCSDCIKLKSIKLTPEGYVELTFLISHPFPKGTLSKPPSGSNRLDLDVFDPAMVVTPTNATPITFYLTGSQAYTDFCINTDGYTRELSNLTGKNTACPYFLVIDNSDTPTSNYNKFEMGTKDAPLVTYFKASGNFTLYLTMGYGSSAKKSTRLIPTYYNPEFNRKSAWKVDVTPPEGTNTPSIGNTWDDHDTSTAYNVTIKVHDWQQNSTVAANYPDPSHKDQILKASKVSKVSVEIPGMNNLLQTKTTPQSGTGSASDPLVYVIPIANERKLAAGEYSALVKVTDERIPPMSVNRGTPDALVNSPNGASQEWKAIPEFATYQVFTATVVVGKLITVTAPNGYENWDVNSTQDIKWTSVGPITNVKIDLSKDSGATFAIPIVASTPNSGTYTIPSVGSWTSGHCRIRVADASETGIFDLSDHDFAVDCPLPAPPGNVSATDGVYYNKVRVTWSAVPGATGYNIYRNGTLKQANFIGTLWDDMNPTPGVIFYYQISTNDLCGEGQKGPANPGEPGSACVLPATPTGLNASDGTWSDRIVLGWNAATGATSYNVYRNSVLVQSGVTVTNWSDFSVLGGVIYSYEVESQNACGKSATKSAPNTGYELGCTPDSHDTCSTSWDIYYNIQNINGCVDQIDEDWFNFYVSPMGFTSSSNIQLTIPFGTVNIYIYALDPGSGCPGTLIASATNVASTTVNVPASTKSRVFVRLIGNSGKVDYMMSVNFKLALTHIPIELYVATTNGTSTGTWPSGLNHATLLQMVTWANNFWNIYGFDLVWDNAETFMAASYYVLNTDSEDYQMHMAYGYGKGKLALYFVNQLYDGNTAFCKVFQNQSLQNVNNVYSVYCPNVYTWQNVIAHEHGHGIGYLQDMYLYDNAPCASCACGDDVCLSLCLTYTQFLYSDPTACYMGNQMYFTDPSKAWSYYDFTKGQGSYVQEFHFVNPTNFPWY